MPKKPYYDTEKCRKYFVDLYGEDTEEQAERYKKAFLEFKKTYRADCAYIASSSGRVEICGNHTDHNGGKVVSAAISLDTLAMFLPTDDDIVRIKSEGYDDITVNLKGKADEKAGTSAALVRGVAEGIKKKGYKAGGFKGYFTSNVIGGAGISSSASFEVLVAEIFGFLYNDGKITAEEKAVAACFAENEYFKKPCGLLDQTAIAFGGLKLLDFKDKNKISVENISNKLEDFTLILVNGGGSHENLTDEYAAIPKEMFQVAAAMGKERLIDVDKKEFFEKLPAISNNLPDRAILRAIHFFEENERVVALKDALDKGDSETFLKCVENSGLSSLWKLQNCSVAGSAFQPVTKAIAICKQYIVRGANRVHGGGFAGSILNIVGNECKEEFLKNASRYFGASVFPLHVRSVGTIVL